MPVQLSDCRQRTSAGPTSARGFTLIELLAVVALIGIASAVAVVALPGATRGIRADSEMQRLVAGLLRSRDLAVTERRNVALEFPSEAELRAVRQDVTGGSVTGTTVLQTVMLEAGFQYRLFPGLPDTPDGFGTAAPRAFGGATALLFTSEGALVDQTGDPVNGTLFIGRAEEPLTARAVTVLGSTGLVTGYRWNGRRWTR